MSVDRNIKSCKCSAIMMSCPEDVKPLLLQQGVAVQVGTLWA